MQKINSESDLKNSILLLEIKQADEGAILREQFHLTYEAIRPINLIKNTLHQVLGSQEIKGGIVSTTVGLTAGYFSKMLFERISNNPFKKILGTALLFGITNVIAKNPEVVRSLGNAVFRLLRRKPSAKIIIIENKENVAEI